MYGTFQQHARVFIYYYFSIDSPWHSKKSPVKAVTSRSSLPYPISAGRLRSLSLPSRKGVKSRTATKPAWPMRHSSSIKIRKCYIVRIGDIFHMNGKFSKRLPTKT